MSAKSLASAEQTVEATPAPVHIIQKGVAPSPTPSSAPSPDVAPRTARGTIVEYPVAVTGGLAEITSGPDGNLWFVAQIGKVGKITASGAITLYDVPGKLLWSIVRGPNGNLWFSETGAIGEITPDGVVTTFPVPLLQARAQIAVGRDGNLWFTNQNGNVGKITPAGVVSIIPVAAPGASLYGAVAGPDGRMWFAGFGADPARVVAVAPSGFASYYAPPLGGNFFALTVGPDNNLWLANSQAALTKLTVRGDFTNYPTLPRGTPWGITSGPDGNLWFTDFGAGAIGRMTPQGKFDEVAVPTPNAEPLGITVGPDGNIWFTEFARNAIGKVLL